MLYVSILYINYHLLKLILCHLSPHEIPFLQRSLESGTLPLGSFKVSSYEMLRKLWRQDVVVSTTFTHDNRVFKSLIS